MTGSTQTRAGPGLAATAASGAEFQRLDPATGLVASTAPACRRREAVLAASRAARSFSEWSRTPPAHRREILTRAAGLIGAHEPEIAATMQAEIGATPLWVRFNLDVGRQHLESAAAMVTQATGTVQRDPSGLSFAFREPVGVCLAMAPWNAPFVLGMRAVATALACGNSVVLKASEICPQTHLLIGRILTEAGLPEGVLNIVTHAPEHAQEVVEALIAHPAVRRINFTGSTRVGRIIAETAARHLKRCLLELGGKAPLIVLEDADLEAAADAAAWGAFFNQGQICMATDRIVVMDSVAEDFIALLSARAARLRAGDPRQDACALGPLVSANVAPGGWPSCCATRRTGARCCVQAARRAAISWMPPWWTGWRPAWRFTPRNVSAPSPASAAPRPRPRRSASPTIRNTGCRPRSSAATPGARCGWRGNWKPASATSTARR